MVLAAVSMAVWPQGVLAMLVHGQIPRHLKPGCLPLRAAISSCVRSSCSGKRMHRMVIGAMITDSSASGSG